MVAEHTGIEWTDHTWNPVTGCSIHSPGCLSCYAMNLAATRLRHHASRAGLTKDSKAGPVWTGELRFNEEWLNQPLRWRTPADVFVCAHTDLYHEDMPAVWQRRVFDVIRAAPRHRYQVLTKRADVMRMRLRDERPLPQVWLGVSVERQQEADERRGDLEALAAAGWNTWVSYEPALGPVNWSSWDFIRWLVSGGESKSGPREARPSHPDWHRAARDFCQSRAIPYHFKQWGEWVPHLDRDKDDPGWRQPYSRWQESREFTFLNRAGGCGFHGERLHVMRRVGKKRAGAMLDGREWREMPVGVKHG